MEGFKLILLILEFLFLVLLLKNLAGSWLLLRLLRILRVVENLNRVVNVYHDVAIFVFLGWRRLS
jgi:hypothetical protein